MGRISGDIGSNPRVREGWGRMADTTGVVGGSPSWRMDLVRQHAAVIVELADKYEAGPIYLTGSVARGDDSDEPRPPNVSPSDIDFWAPEWVDDPDTNETRARSFLEELRILLGPSDVDVRPMGAGWPIDGDYLEGFERDAIAVSALLP